MNNEIKPVATFGDIVTVKGYGNRVFLVEEFTIEYQHHPDGRVTPSVIYDLTCPFTFDYIIGEQADITVVCKAATAHTYLTQIEPYTPDAPIDYVKPTYNLQIITPADVAPKPKRKTQRQKQAEIDGLLDELITMQTVIDICGEDCGCEAEIRGGDGMTEKDIQTLMEARSLIGQLAGSLGIDISDLPEDYNDSYEGLYEIISREAAI